MSSEPEHPHVHTCPRPRAEPAGRAALDGRQPNRVPQATADFWLIKLMAVTMGETAADYLAVNLGLGLTATSLMMAAFLAGALALQFARDRYVPWTYWLAVVLISIVGTLVTDNLVDNLGVSLCHPYGRLHRRACADVPRLVPS